MSSKHTPGPWIAVDKQLAESLPHRWIAFCGGFGYSVITEKAGNLADVLQSFDNARLIAAAPELLEACKFALQQAELSIAELLEEGYPANGGSVGAMRQEAAIYRAAIAKATGQE